MIKVIIPARYQSTRFPGKPLALIAGKSMIQRVYEQASKASLVQEVIVATDDQRIYDAVIAFSGNVVMTADTHQSGTDRLAEVALKQQDIDIIVNVQGDEPVIPPECIDMAVQPLIDDPSVSMATLVRKCTSAEDLHNPNIVKAVLAKNNFALYFSRSCIPFERNQTELSHYLHIGLYVYRRQTLLQLSQLEPALIERTESLEQLRALYNGINIKAVVVDYAPIGVDTPEDIIKVEQHPGLQ